MKNLKLGALAMIQTKLKPIVNKKKTLQLRINLLKTLTLVHQACLWSVLDGSDEQ